MTVYEIRDPSEARHHLLTGMWLSRSAPLNSQRLGDALRWAAELVSDGSPLPPLGFVIDVGHVIAGSLRGAATQVMSTPMDLDMAVWSRYEDYVLGKLYSDMSFERGADAIQRYRGRDQDRAIAYAINAIRTRGGFGGALLSPAVLNSLRSRKPEEVLGQSMHQLEQDGWSDELIEEFEDLINAVRMTGDLLGPEDIFELESGTALAEFGQRVALRQVLQASAFMEAGLPKQKPRATPRQYSVATNIMDEDSYPIGGFTSISNRGTVESLLRSELAYMDADDDARPDLFDVKYVRDELLYYARDENQFLRRRLSFFFIIHPDVEKLCFKNGDCSWQEIVYVLGLIALAVRKLTEWLSDDAIHFEVLFLNSATPATLEDEYTLLETLLGEELGKDLLRLERVDPDEAASRLTASARRTLCHATSIGGGGTPLSELPIASSLRWDGSTLQLRLGDDAVDCGDSGDLAWKTCAEAMMRWWV